MSKEEWKSIYRKNHKHWDAEFPPTSTRKSSRSGIYLPCTQNHREPESSNTFKYLQTLQHNARTYGAHFKKQTHECGDWNQDWTYRCLVPVNQRRERRTEDEVKGTRNTGSTEVLFVSAKLASVPGQVLTSMFRYILMHMCVCMHAYVVYICLHEYTQSLAFEVREYRWFKFTLVPCSSKSNTSSISITWALVRNAEP